MRCEYCGTVPDIVTAIASCITNSHQIGSRGYTLSMRCSCGANLGEHANAADAGDLSKWRMWSEAWDRIDGLYPDRYGELVPDSDLDDED
jgi:hypothetical protein